MLQDCASIFHLSFYYYRINKIFKLFRMTKYLVLTYFG